MLSSHRVWRTLTPVCCALLLSIAACKFSDESSDEWPGLEVLLRATPVDPQARGVDGRDLAFSPPSGDALERQRVLLGEARDRLYRSPADPEAWIWVGRRLAYLGRYRASQQVYTQGLKLNPQSHRLLRHRGHRWITLREFDRAIEDLTLAAELSQYVPDRIEEDGLPNPAGVPTGTDRTNITYHLALAHYLRGEFDAAAMNWEACYAAADNPDMWIAAAYWLYHARSRAGDRPGAAAVLAGINPEWELLENHAYQRLLHHYRGELSRDEVLSAASDDGIAGPTTLYGLAVYDREEGRIDQASAGFAQAVDAGSWAAFGAIAAEVDAARNAGLDR